MVKYRVPLKLTYNAAQTDLSGELKIESGNSKTTKGLSKVSKLQLHAKLYQKNVNLLPLTQSHTCTQSLYNIKSQLLLQEIISFTCPAILDCLILFAQLVSERNKISNDLVQLKVFTFLLLLDCLLSYHELTVECCMSAADKYFQNIFAFTECY